jgi:hypothetical protein
MVRSCVGLTKWFDLLDVHDRLMVIGEFFYAGAGYDKNVFADTRQYQYKQPVTVAVPGSQPAVLTFGDAKTFLLANNLYTANEYSPYYLALFSSISRFITSSMSLNLNAIGNLKQQCAAVSAGVTYTSLSDFSLGTTLVGYIGRENTEYTYQKNAVMLQLTAGMTF